MPTQPLSSKSLVIRPPSHTALAQAKTWWAPLWRGLIVDAEAKHYKRMRSSIYLYLFFLLHADRRTGTLMRRLPTIAAETGINVHTLRQWLATLRQEGYVTTEFTGRALRIRIQRWKPLSKLRSQSAPSPHQTTTRPPSSQS